MAGSLIRKLKVRLKGVLYVQIWESRLKVTNLTTGETFDESANVAIKTADNGKKSIKFGNEALVISDSQTMSFNPFSHPRTLLVDPLIVEKYFVFVFKKLKSSFIFSPIVMIHPMEKVEGDLVTIERQGFITVAKNAGAKEVFTYVGDKLTGDIFIKIYTEEMGRDEIRELEEGK